MAKRVGRHRGEYLAAQNAVDYDAIVGDPDGETATTVGDTPEQKAQYTANHRARVARDAARDDQKEG